MHIAIINLLTLLVAGLVLLISPTDGTQMRDAVDRSLLVSPIPADLQPLVAFACAHPDLPESLSELCSTACVDQCVAVKPADKAQQWVCNYLGYADSDCTAAVFDDFWKQGLGSCCFGDTDGVSNCNAAILNTCGDDFNPSTPTITPPPPPPVVESCTYSTTFFDDFTTLDSSNWNLSNRENNHNEELQYYLPENVAVSSGKLVLTPKEKKKGSKDWTSGRVNSKDKKFFKYGRFTVRAKVPSGLGLWPAIWMMPQNRTYGSWAASGEIDIFEGDGSKPQFVSSALHFGGESPNNKQIATSDSDPFSSVCPKVEGVDLSEEFHDYVLVWSKDKMTFMVDTKIQWEVDLAKNWGYEEDNVPWDQPFYFIFNVAVGGWFLNDRQPYPGVGETWSSPSMEIDFVKVEQREGDDEGNCKHPVKEEEEEQQQHCRVKDGVSADDLQGSLNWLCGDSNNFVDINCNSLYEKFGINDSNAVAKANVAFNEYWKLAGKSEKACCFGNKDGVTDCKAELYCVGEGRRGFLRE